MKEIAILIGTLIVHIFSSKGIALALFLILFWIKGRQLKFYSEKWENYFLKLSQKKVVRIALSISGLALIISAWISYLILHNTGFDYAYFITIVLFCGSAAVFWCKWRGKKGKEYLLKRFAEIPQTILDKRERESHI